MNRPNTALALRPDHDDPSFEDGVAEFAALRRRLFAVAYRVLGSWTDAEDIVQDAWLKWQHCDRRAVLNPSAFLVTMTTRLALNAAQSARARRETSVGDWASEPEDTRHDPQQLAGRDEALELGIELLLERLTPTERAAYVLREAFDYPYARIGQLLHLSEVNARQVVRRAGRHLAAPRRGPVGGDERRRLLFAFVAAARSGELAQLEQMLRTDVRARRPVDAPVPA
jgi:RNA polymerase sigma-70 factor (ECF subfamily)